LSITTEQTGTEHDKIGVAYSNLLANSCYVLDLLPKSGFEFEFKIVDGSNQIKAE